MGYAWMCTIAVIGNLREMDIIAIIKIRNDVKILEITVPEAFRIFELKLLSNCTFWSFDLDRFRFLQFIMWTDENSQKS